MKQLFNNLSESLHSKYNVFFASASFESRSVSAINIINEKISFDYKIAAINSSNEDQCLESTRRFEELGFTFVKVHSSDQLQTVVNLVDQTTKILKGIQDASFLIDITSFTRQTLLILLRVLQTLLSIKNKVQFIYSTASEYSIGLPMEEKWLTRGILEVNSVFGYSGKIRPSRPYHLIILMGFEVERASSLIIEYEPAKISVGYATQKSSISDEFYSLNRNRFEELQNEFPGLEAFEFSCTNLENCKKDILSRVNEYSDFNVIVSPMNNKISTVACALAAFENDNIQLVIALPALYNSVNYSKPGDKYYLFEIDNLV